MNISFNYNNMLPATSNCCCCCCCDSGFGYESMNSMIGGMFGGYGMSGMNGMFGGYGMSGMNGMFGGYGMNGMSGFGGYGMNGCGCDMGGFGGMFGLQGSMSLPVYSNTVGDAWATTLDTTLGKRDPVYLDTNHDGQLNVEKLKKNISFDMNGDGIADTVKEWNTQDAQLVYDANGDGQINSGREMMNEVGVNGEQNKYANGWEKARDLFDTNKDGILSAEELEKASFWTDANGNGKVDEGELKSAADMGITGIDTENGKFLQQEQIGDLNLNFGFGGFGMGGFGGFGMSFTPTGADSASFGMGIGGFGGGIGMGSMMGGYGMGSMMGGYGMGSMMGGYGMGSMMGGYGMGSMMGGYGMGSMMGGYGMGSMMGGYGMGSMMGGYGSTFNNFIYNNTGLNFANTTSSFSAMNSILAQQIQMQQQSLLSQLSGNMMVAR